MTELAWKSFSIDNRVLEDRRFWVNLADPTLRTGIALSTVQADDDEDDE